jgi:hypothetical protein
MVRGKKASTRQRRWTEMVLKVSAVRIDVRSRQRFETANGRTLDLALKQLKVGLGRNGAEHVKCREFG